MSSSISIENVPLSIPKETIEQCILDFIQFELNSSNISLKILESNHKIDKTVLIQFEDKHISDELLKHELIIINSELFNLKPSNPDPETTNYTRILILIEPAYKSILSSKERLKQFENDLKSSFQADLEISNCIQIKRLDCNPPFCDSNEQWVDRLRSFLTDFYDSFSVLDDLTLKPVQRLEVYAVFKPPDQNKPQLNHDYKTYKIDTLANFQLRILIIEDYVNICTSQIDKDLRIELTNQAVSYHGKWESIEISKNKLWDIVQSIKEKTFNIEKQLLSFIYENKASIEGSLRLKSLKSIIDKTMSESDTESLLIRSICLDTINETFKFIKSNFVVEYFNFDENSANFVKTQKFRKFLTKIIIEKNQNICVKKDKIVFVGEKSTVDRISSDLRQFFELNTLITKDLTSSFSYEDLKYFQIVSHDQIDLLSQEVIIELECQKPFDLRIQIDRKTSKIEVLSLKITSNSSYHKKYLNLLNKCLENRVSEDYSLKTVEMIDLFTEPKVLAELGDLERLHNCVILPPKQSSTVDTGSSVFYIKDNLRVKLTTLDTNVSLFDKSDVLVVYSNKTLEPLDNKSKLLVKQAGQSVFDELKSILNANDNLIPVGQVYHTNPGSFGPNFKALLHCVLNYNIGESLSEVVYQCLQECEFREYETIAFTILDINNNILNLYLESIKNYFYYVSDSNLKEIFFIDQKTKLISELFLQKTKILNSKFFLSDLEKPIEKKKFEFEPKKIIKISNEPVIDVIYGSIVDESVQVDVIVNSADRKLQLNSGAVSTCILNSAGAQILEEIYENYPNGLNDQIRAAITSAGNLKGKKYIIHLALSNWNDSEQEKTRKEFKKTINTVLALAESKHVSSLAFPPLGAGNLNYPKHEVPKLMFKYIKEYFSLKKHASCIKRVCFVIYKGDVETVKAFSEYQSGKALSDDDDESEEGQGINFTKSNDECSLGINGTIFRVYIGDITASTSDYIFNPTNDGLNTDGNVSKALLTSDPNMLNEITVLQKNFTGIAVCKAGGGLQCKNIIHIDVLSKSSYNSVKDALNEVNNRSGASITFPVIGTGHVKNSDPSKCCETIINAVFSFLNCLRDKNQKCLVKQIEICIFPTQRAFLHYFIHHIEILIRKTKKSKNQKTENSIFETLKSYWPFKKSQNEDEDLEPKIKSVKIEDNTQLKFKLISNKKSNIEAIKLALEEIADQEMEIKDFTDESLIELDSETRAEIQRISKENKTLLYWNDQSPNKLTLVGLHRNISNCILKILKLINDHFKFKETKISAELTSQNVQWQFKENNKWLAFNILINNELEKKYQNFIHNSSDHIIELLDERFQSFRADVKNNFKALKSEPDNRSEIRRVDLEKINFKFKYPDNWEHGKHMDLITLPNDHEEYKAVEQLITNTGLKTVLKRVVTIQRVQNRHLYIQYINYRSEMEINQQNNQVERILYHGTNENCVDSIWKSGFNRSYAGKNATLYGKGVYFARDSAYSHTYTDIRLGQPRGHMFIAKVVVGKVSNGGQNLNIPPANADTTVDNVANPSIFVIFKDAQAYPEYLLTYE